MVRFRVPVRIPVEVPEGSGANTFRRVSVQIQYLVRVWRAPMQIPGEVPEGSGADSR